MNMDIKSEIDNKSLMSLGDLSNYTKDELKLLQEKVRERSERASLLSNIEKRNDDLKILQKDSPKIGKSEIAIGSPRLSIAKECKLSASSETDSVFFKRSLRDLQSKNLQLFEENNSLNQENIKQEEYISQLKRQVSERVCLEAENMRLNEKLQNLERNQQFSEEKEFSPFISELNLKNSGGGDNTEEDLKEKYNRLFNHCKNLQEENTQLIKRYTKGSHTVLKAGGNVTPTTFDKTKKRAVSQELHELRKQNSVLTVKLKSLSDEHLNCQEMHEFLRGTIDKIQGDNVRNCEEVSSLKVILEQKKVNSEHLIATINEQNAEKDRILSSYKELENKFKAALEQNRLYRKSQDPKVIESLQKTVANLQKQCIGMKDEMDRMTREVNYKLSLAQRDLNIEKERADSCLAQSLEEREKLENKWQERWSRHKSTLNEQLESLKANYEGSLKSAREREEALQRDLKDIVEKQERNKESWEKQRKNLNDELLSWKDKHESASGELEEVYKGKVKVEIMFQEKTKELDTLHEMVRQECAEREELKKKMEDLEQNLEQFTENESTTATFSLDRFKHSSLFSPISKHSFPNPLSRNESEDIISKSEFILDLTANNRNSDQNDENLDEDNFNQSNCNIARSESFGSELPKTPFVITHAIYNAMKNSPGNNMISTLNSHLMNERMQLTSSNMSNNNNNNNSNNNYNNNGSPENFSFTIGCGRPNKMVTKYTQPPINNVKISTKELPGIQKIYSNFSKSEETPKLSRYPLSKSKLCSNKKINKKKK